MNKQASLSEDTNCPICLDIPKNEVFQCVNGHTICGDCLNKVSKCPQCALPYDAVKIRNRALESILDKMKLDCAYKSKGCTSQLTRKDISSHNKSCKFGATPIKFCQFLQFSSCEFIMYTNQMETARAHFREAHNSKIYTSSSMSFRLPQIAEDGTPSIERPNWAPMILDLHGESFLVFIIHSFALGQISMHFVTTSGSPSDCSKFSAEFRVKTQKAVNFPDLVWRGPAVHINQIVPTIQKPITRFHKDLWKDYRNKDGEILINVSVSKT